MKKNPTKKPAIVPTTPMEIRGQRRLSSSSDGDTILVSDFKVYRNGKPFDYTFPAKSKTSKGYLKVRVLGVDSTELHYTGPLECRVPANRLKRPKAPKIVPQEPWGTLAKDWLDKQLGEFDDVIVELEDEVTDRYKRVLGYLWTVKGKWQKDRLLNADLVRAGHAFPYQIFPNKRYFRAIKEAAQDAIGANSGVFAAHTNTLLSLARVAKGKQVNEPFLYRKVVDAAICQDVAKELLTRQIGDVRDFKYYPPKQYLKVPIQYRLFFDSKEAAEKAGYMKA